MGLHVFDPSEMNIEMPYEVEMVELNSMVDRVLAMHHDKRFRKDDRKFELSLTNLKNGLDFVEGSLASYDPVLDEASYFSWVENFKEASQLSKSTVSDLVNRHNLPNDRHIKLEDARKKAEEKKLAKWDALGYNSLVVKDPIRIVDNDLLSNLGSINFVVGDCTHPEKYCHSKASIIFSCVDDSSNWGHGGMFDALARLSSRIPNAYQRASESRDLHLGDVHLIKVTDWSSRKQNGVQIALAFVFSALHCIFSFSCNPHYDKQRMVMER